MKRLTLIAVMVLVVLTALSFYGCQTTGNDATIGIAAGQQEGIWVTGTGKVSATPDIASVRLGVEAQAVTVAEAQSQANGAMAKVMEALTASGVAAKDIQTQYYNVQKVTRWDREKEQEVLVGYRVTNLVTAKIRDVNKAGTVIDAATRAGGDLIRVDSISFTIDDPLPYYDRAREKAMAELLDKAKRLATLAGVKLGKPTYISEYGSPGTLQPIYAAKEAFDRSQATAISARELEITVTIQAVYTIR